MVVIPAEIIPIPTTDKFTIPIATAPKENTPIGTNQILITPIATIPIETIPTGAIPKAIFFGFVPQCLLSLFLFISYGFW